MFPGVFASTVREEGMADLREDVRIHALLVDDDGRLQTNARDFLEPYGCKISSLHDGRGIEAALEELKPDIVLLDVMLPIVLWGWKWGRTIICPNPSIPENCLPVSRRCCAARRGRELFRRNSIRIC